jgi:hypothetical protein
MRTLNSMLVLQQEMDRYKLLEKSVYAKSRRKFSEKYWRSLVRLKLKIKQ